MQLFIFLAPLPLHVSTCITKAAASVEKDCIEKKPPEDGCMEPKHVVEEEQEI
jgi:hypothetical protein